MLKGIVCVVAALILFAGLHPAQAAEGAFCNAANGALMMAPASDGPKELLAKARAACKPQDIILLPARNVGVVGSICDFSKSIVVTPDGSLLCVYKSGSVKVEN
jgi:hypothetical protein